MERINEKHKMLSEAYAKYVPRYEGDQQYDVRTVEQLIGKKLHPII